MLYHTHSIITLLLNKGTQKVTKRNNKIISPLTEENAACTSHETDVHSKVTKRGYC